MASQASWDYLLNAVKKDDERLGVLCDWFFGENLTSERLIERCAEIAYKDLQRNLGGIGGTGDAAKVDAKDKFKVDVVAFIRARILLLLDMAFPKEPRERQDAFDGWHQEACEGIREIAGDINRYLEKEFSYGLAQKWLNMTLKNMLVAETAEWHKKLYKVKKLLHVPVDSYVIDAAQNGLGIRDEKRKNYPTTWSGWEYDVYDRFQKRVREAVDRRDDYDCPMAWEFDAWIVAKNN